MESDRRGQKIMFNCAWVGVPTSMGLTATRAIDSLGMAESPAVTRVGMRTGMGGLPTTSCDCLNTLRSKWLPVPPRNAKGWLTRN